MRTDRFRQGDVIAYPYRWKHQPASTVEHPKLRPVCIAIRLKKAKDQDTVVLLPISDLPPANKADAVALGLAELRAAGLTDRRKAYVHLTEANIDNVFQSLTFNPKAEVLGRLTEPSLRRVLAEVKKQLLAKNLALIHRNRRG